MVSEEYSAARMEHIVRGVYGGDDALPLETKEFLIKRAYGEGVHFGRVHTTRVDENGKNIGDGHTRFALEVAVLEFGFLIDKGFILPELC